jgi:hypothetical protein
MEYNEGDLVNFNYSKNGEPIQSTGTIVKKYMESYDNEPTGVAYLIRDRNTIFNTEKYGIPEQKATIVGKIGGGRKKRSSKRKMMKKRSTRRRK